MKADRSAGWRTCVCAESGSVTDQDQQRVLLVVMCSPDLAHCHVLASLKGRHISPPAYWSPPQLQHRPKPLRGHCLLMVCECQGRTRRVLGSLNQTSVDVVASIMASYYAAIFGVRFGDQDLIRTKRQLGS